MKKIIVIFAIGLLLSGCVVSSSSFEKAQNEVSRLKSQNSFLANENIRLSEELSLYRGGGIPEEDEIINPEDNFIACAGPNDFVCPESYKCIGGDKETEGKCQNTEKPIEKIANNEPSDTKAQTTPTKTEPKIPTQIGEVKLTTYKNSRIGANIPYPRYWYYRNFGANIFGQGSLMITGFLKQETPESWQDAPILVLVFPLNTKMESQPVNLTGNWVVGDEFIYFVAAKNGYEKFTQAITKNLH